jgi:hypothetical protein
LNSGEREDFEKGKMDELMRIKYFDGMMEATSNITV